MSRRARSPATVDDVLRYVAECLEAHDGISPSYQEMGDALGINSKSNISRKIDALEAAGMLRRLRGRSRAIEILQPIALPRTTAGEPLYFVRIPQ
ncbi:MAG: LexA family protein [Pseudomonas paracarnis]